MGRKAPAGFLWKSRRATAFFASQRGNAKVRPRPVGSDWLKSTTLRRQAASRMARVSLAFASAA